MNFKITFLALILLISAGIHAGEFLFPTLLADMKCENDTEGVVISFIRENTYCPETSYRCFPIMNVINGKTIKFESENLTSHLIEFQGPNDVQTRYLESELGTMHGQIWAWGSKSVNNSIWFNVDMKTCLINKGSENIDIAKKTKCNFTIKEDGYYSFAYYKNGGWRGVSSQYSFSPCIKIIN